MNELEQEIIKEGTSQVMRGITENINKLFPYLGVKKEAVNTLIKGINESEEYTPVEKAVLIANSKKLILQQKNINDIIKLACQNSSEETDFSSSSTIDEEWLDRFMDSAKFVNDEELKLIWSRVLSGEFENPGTFDKSIIRVLSELPKLYAEVFSNLCRTQITIYNLDTHNNVRSKIQRVCLPSKVILEEEYNNIGLHFGMITELQNMGLINYYESAEAILRWDISLYPTVKVKYGNEEITVTKYTDKAFMLGAVTLTNLGESLARLTEVETIPGYLNHIKEYFIDKGMEFH